MTVRSLLAALLLLPPALAAQQPAPAGARTVHLVVRDSASGQPVMRAGIQSNGWRGLAWTDSAGSLSMRGGGDSTILTIRCPVTRRLMGRVARRETVAAAAQADTQVTLTIDEAACMEPPLESVAGEFRGHYESGFESSDFRPCGGLPAGARAYDDRWGAAWVRFSDTASVKRLVPTGARPKGQAGVYVRWRGTLTGPGTYGHLGVATYELVVDEILEVRGPRESDCR